MKRLVISLFVLALAATAAPAFAADYAVVNVQEIMRESQAGKSIKAQLDKKQKEFQSQISSREESLQKENQELAKQRSVLSKDAFEEKVKGFNVKAAEVQKDVQTKRQQLDKAFGQSVTEIQKTVQSILDELAKEKGFKLVFPAQQVLFNDPSLDITKEVMDRLNKKLPNVTLNF